LFRLVSYLVLGGLPRITIHIDPSKEEAIVHHEQMLHIYTDHMGIEGNEKADQAAKQEAETKEPSQCTVSSRQRSLTYTRKLGCAMARTMETRTWKCNKTPTHYCGTKHYPRHQILSENREPTNISHGSQDSERVTAH
jgi:hypothetical protein